MIDAASYYCSAHQITSTWAEGTVTWDNSLNFNSTSLYNRNVSSTGWKSWSSKSLVTGWVKGTTDNYGVLVKGVDETQYRRLRTAYSSESISSNKPELHVSYYLPKVVYYLKDHLGSTRVVVDEDGNVVESYDYFPFGLAARTTGGNTIYKFTEKELDNETNNYYFGARYYDAEVGRFVAVDPLAEKHPEWTPYHYCLDNPLKYLDPKGEQVVAIKGWRIPTWREVGTNLSRAWANAKFLASSGQTYLAAGQLMVGVLQSGLLERLDPLGLSGMVGVALSETRAAILAANRAAGALREAETAAALASEGLSFEQQVVRGSSRLDFVVSKLGKVLEVKGINWSAKTYQKSGGVSGLLTKLRTQLRKYINVLEEGESLTLRITKPQDAGNIKRLERLTKELGVDIEWIK